MLDLASLQQFDFFSNFTLYAGSKGLYRTVSNVVVLDHEGFEDNYSDFHEGDFVLTNLFYAKDHPECIFSSFSQLIQIGVSAIAIKSIFFHELPEEVILLADEKNVPIFFFHSIYIEDVIMNIIDYLRSSTNSSYYENLIDSFIHTNFNEDSMNRFLADCTRENHRYLSSIYLSYIKPIDEVTLQRHLNKILHKKNLLTYQDDILCLKYKKGIMVLHFYSEQSSPAKVMQDWGSILYELQISNNNYYIGFSDELLPVKKTDIAIQRSIYANTCAVKDSTGKMKYSELRLNNLILPLSESRYVKEYLISLHNTLSSCEGQHKHLLDTLIAYVKCDFNIDNTSKLLFLHPNAVRYRLNKIKVLLNCREDLEFHVIAVLMSSIVSTSE